MIYAFNEYELDTLTVEVRRSGEVIHVEPQVFGVLAHLVANRDRVVSKIELLDEVWTDRFVSESALTSRLQAARKACGDSGREQRVIRTKHGRGYRFVADVVEYTDDLATTSPAGTRPVAAAGPRAEVTSDEILGRDSELQVVDQAIADATAGRGRMVFVAGAAGMGKSTLVETALERVESGIDIPILDAQCRSHRRIPEPYVSLLDALSRFGRDHGDVVVATLEQVAPMWLMQLPSLLDSSRIEALDRRVLGGTHERMLREGVDLLDHLARPSALIVVLEDLHWADPPTIELIAWLAGRVEQCSMLVLGTYRPGEEVTGQLDAVVAELAIARSADRLELEPLDAVAVGRAIGNRLNTDDVDGDLARLVTVRTGGNPLFVSEQVESWLNDEEIGVIDGRAVAPAGVDSLDDSVPEGVRQLIERSLERLDDADVQLLEAGAVIGREFPAFAVAAALSSPIPEIEDRLGSLSRRGASVTAAGDDAWPDGTISTVFRLTHDLHQQTLYDRASASRRATIHQVVGERLERAYGDRTDEHVASLLRHFAASGDVDRSVAYLQRTGELSLARSAHSEAIEPLQSALDLLDRLPDTTDRDRREVSLRTSLGPALVATLGWRQPEVQANYERALDLATALNALPERFILRYGLAVVHELRGEYNRSEELLDEQISDGSELSVESRELLACSTFHQGAYDRSLEHAVAAVDLWDPDTHSTYMARYGEHPGVSSSTWAALSAWHLGQPDLSMQMAERAIEWGSDNDYALTTAWVQMAFLHQYRDEPEQCRFWAEKTIRLADVQGFPFRAAQGQIMLGWCSAVEGDPEGGIEEMNIGLTRYRATGARMDEPYYLGLLVDAELRAGRPDDALVHLAEAADVIENTTRSFFYEPELDRLHAVALIARHGDAARPDAADLLARAALTATNHASLALAMRVAVTSLELGIEGGAEDTRDELRRLLDAYADHGDLPDVERATAVISA